VSCHLSSIIHTPSSPFPVSTFDISQLPLLGGDRALSHRFSPSARHPPEMASSSLKLYPRPVQSYHLVLSWPLHSPLPFNVPLANLSSLSAPVISSPFSLNSFPSFLHPSRSRCALSSRLPFISLTDLASFQLSLHLFSSSRFAQGLELNKQTHSTTRRKP
jgi:hypothetical protein